MGNDIKAIVGIIGVTLLIVFGGVFFLTKSNSKPQSLSEVKRASSELLIKGDSHKSSSVATPVTIVEWGDFQCPACAAAFPTVQKILSDYNGKVALVFRHFPLPQHKNAMIAAEAAESADQEGKFWMMYDLLYSNQDKWAESDNPMDEFLKYADQIRMDRDKFKKPIDEKKYEDKIKKDEEDGIALGITATPTFYINGIKLQGAPQYEDFKLMIDEELKTAK